MTREELVQQIAACEAEQENAKAVVYRCDGALQLMKFMLAKLDAETSEKPVKAKKAKAEKPAVES